jgi:hypothetical protein
MSPGPPPIVNPSLALPARHESPLDDIPIQPGLQPISLPEYVCLDSVRAALEKFDIKVPVNDIILAIREEESKLVAERRRELSPLTMVDSSELCRLSPIPQLVPPL